MLEIGSSACFEKINDAVQADPFSRKIGKGKPLDSRCSGDNLRSADRTLILVRLAKAFILCPAICALALPSQLYPPHDPDSGTSVSSKTFSRGLCGPL
jgi:hypothetical protein